MSYPAQRVAFERVDDRRVLLADSVTWVDERGRGEVVVSGSHGGTYSALAGGSLGPKALLLNDAGVGKESAGIAGLWALDAYEIGAATVDCWTARIGDARDTLESGRISNVNLTAARCGVEPGMTAGLAARLLLAASAGTRPARPGHPEERSSRAAVDLPIPVYVLDSASLVDESMREGIVVTGSHGGLIGGAAIKNRVRAAFFNDAGIGKQEAGVARLALLERNGIPAMAVDHRTARIGDGRDALENGVVSRANGTAAAAGVVVGRSVREACGLVAGTVTARARKGS